MKYKSTPAAPSRLSDHAKHQLEQQLATFLEREGFRVDESQQDTDFHLAVVKATRDECRLLIAIVSPKGDQRAFLTQLAAPGDQVSFVFQGKIYKEQPIWRPLIHQYLVRQFQNYAGMKASSADGPPFSAARYAEGGGSMRRAAVPKQTWCRSKAPTRQNGEQRCQSQDPKLRFRR